VHGITRIVARHQRCIHNYHRRDGRKSIILTANALLLTPYAAILILFMLPFSIYLRCPVPSSKHWSMQVAKMLLKERPARHQMLEEACLIEGMQRFCAPCAPSCCTAASKGSARWTGSRPALESPSLSLPARVHSHTICRLGPSAVLLQQPQLFLLRCKLREHTGQAATGAACRSACLLLSHASLPGEVAALPGSRAAPGVQLLLQLADVRVRCEALHS